MLTLLSKATRRQGVWDNLDRTLLEHTSEGCWVVDRDLVTVYVNPALCALLGYREGELLGSHLLTYVAEESLHVLERQVVMRDLAPHRSYDVTLKRADGLPVYVIFNASRLDDEAGIALGSCIFVTDISRRHEMETQREAQHAQLADTVARLNRFMGQICQDLKDPLSAILGATQMISADAAANAAADGGAAEGRGKAGSSLHAYAALCNDAGRQIMRTIENLSLWSRLQLNQVPMELRVYELGGLLQDILEEMEPRARARDILIVNRIFTTHVLGDLTGLTTTLRHLIENAVRFSPSGSIVMLSASAVDGRVAVRVQDNGLGIPEEVLPYLFRIDHHHASPGADGELGSGLGLLIAKSLVERMGGTIRLYSRPGGGTAVTLTLTEGISVGGV
ncbi:sensor histidine kinase [Azospirillum sp. sgz302134]